LGYPLARAVLEKYGVKGVKLALEKHPPTKAQYFANPQAYLTQLEKLTAVIQ
jgi:ABC-type Zn uptake system ZnuABC Zn-binding protein ZnuA